MQEKCFRTPLIVIFNVTSVNKSANKIKSAISHTYPAELSITLAVQR